MTLKLQDLGIDGIDLGFELPEPGVSLVQVEEGVGKFTNENSGKTTFKIPLVIDKVIEGPETNQGLKMVHFCPIETSYGEKQLGGILDITGLIDACSQKFGAEVNVTDDSFLDFVTLRLIGKFIRVKHKKKTDNQGRDQVDIIRIERFNGQPGGVKAEVKAEDKSW